MGLGMQRGSAGAEAKTLKEKLSQPEFRRRADEMLARLTLEAPFWPENEEKQQQRLRRAAADPLYFCRTYLPHHFSQVSAPFHYELVKLLAPPSAAGDPPAGPDGAIAGAGTPKPESMAAVVAAPREFGKTTSVFGYVLQQICFRRRRFIIIGSDTEERASDLTGRLYLELLYNQRLHQDFGELAKAGRRVDDFITANGIRVKARGRGQRLRGLKFSLKQPCRPDLVILDDLEAEPDKKYEKYAKDNQEAAGPGMVRQILDWVKLEVLPSLEAGGNLLILGTILRWRSALHLMLTGDEEPFRRFRRRIYRAVQEDGSSLWEARYPAERLKLQKRFMGRAAFNREKMNEPLPEAGLFREEWIHYYHPDILKDRQLLVAGWFEPSLEIGAGAGCRAVVSVG